MKSIQVQLNQYIVLKAKGERVTQKKTISETELEGALREENRTNLEIGFNCEINQASTNGNLITNEFRIEVIPLLDSCLCH